MLTMFKKIKLQPIIIVTVEFLVCQHRNVIPGTNDMFLLGEKIHELKCSANSKYEPVNLHVIEHSS